ncbi:hypothetical protein H9Y04_23065 [Streptomyces sp. TRM66268-LWL]|uniref:Beta-N-acetylhexosaminidase n=1 Tax=Streptomyces polyasparticus TaxID=2767826 RepID=A0ABR7SL44_9ACTN|nr:DUF6049 family protein [Streptomyces polyasparticus]MBC9715435.1 hypothetical protein [Streptomyces polyasparticus]
MTVTRHRGSPARPRRRLALALTALLLPALLGPLGGARAAAADATATKTAVLWPLTATPSMTAAALGSGAAAEAVFDGDALAAEFADGGRLREVVEAGKGREVTWVVDPDLIVAARAMAGGYRLMGSTVSPRDSTKGTGSDAASDWLAALKDAVRDQDVIVLPYADADLASLAHHPGKDTDSITTVVRGLAADGRQAVGEALGTEAAAGLGWPADGVLDEAVTALAGQLGLGLVLASGQGLDGTPSGPVRLPGGKVTALPYDAELTSALAGAEPPSRDRLEALLEAGGHPVVVPPRDLSGAAAGALAAALDAEVRADRLDAAGLDEVSGDPAPAQFTGAYPAALRKSELTGAQLAATADDLTGLATLTRVLANPEATTTSVHAAMARAVSTAWRSPGRTGETGDTGRTGEADPDSQEPDRSAQEAFARTTTDFLATGVTSVHLLPKTGVKLTSGSASLPVTVENGLQQEIAGLELRTTSDDTARITVRDPVVAVRVPGGAAGTVRVGVNARASGPARLTAKLYTTADGKPWGEPIAFEAEVTPVPTTAIVAVVAGAVLIAAAMLLRMRRARRRRT